MMDSMAEKKPDDVMAEYLLKGAKMLAKTCPVCGSPLFTYKDRTFCVVCEPGEAKEQDKIKGREKKQGHVTGGQSRDSPGITGGADPDRNPRIMAYESDALVCALETTLITLTERIAIEPDPDRCLSLMNTVKKGIEALTLLSYP
jgi:UPF0148 protein